MKAGVLFGKGSWWVGVHWSSYNRRFCINLLPYLTIWIVLKGGEHTMKPRLRYDSYWRTWPWAVWENGMCIGIGKTPSDAWLDYLETKERMS